MFKMNGASSPQQVRTTLSRNVGTCSLCTGRQAQAEQKWQASFMERTRLVEIDGKQWKTSDVLFGFHIHREREGTYIP